MRSSICLPIAILWAFAATGCSILCASGPTMAEVENSSKSDPSQGFVVVDDPSQGFVVVDIDAAVASAVSQVRQDGFGGNFKSNAPAANLRIAVGDVMQITIIEAGSGLFGQSDSSATLGSQSVGAQSTSLQPVTVARDGYINVPFAGRIRVAGQTPDYVRVEIERLLADKAVGLQAEVTVVSDGANSATVAGEVNHAAVFPLSLNGNKLLDLIAAAGGARYPAYEINVHLTRSRRSATASLQNIVDNPSENIYIQPRDSIYLSRDPRTFTVFGATTKVGRYHFDTERLNLAEAVAEAGGFVDAAADPSGAFLFRFESPQFVASLRPDLAGKLEARVPVVYRLNLRVGNGYFLAQSFPMRDKDVILLANADGAQLLKFFVLLRGATGAFHDVGLGYLGFSSAAAKQVPAITGTP
jgi:polysaccharide export outer membrane protein